MTETTEEFMELKIHWISKKYLELSVDEITSGTLDSSEAKKLAQHLLEAASELLDIEDVK